MAFEENLHESSFLTPGTLRLSSQVSSAHYNAEKFYSCFKCFGKFKKKDWFICDLDARN